MFGERVLAFRHNLELNHRQLLSYLRRYLNRNSLRYLRHLRTFKISFSPDSSFRNGEFLSRYLKQFNLPEDDLIVMILKNSPVALRRHQMKTKLIISDNVSKTKLRPVSQFSRQICRVS